MNINYYNPYVREELMLYHHGRLGQKWGRRNGPPYPLAASALSAAEKKIAGWRKTIAGGVKAAKAQHEENKRISKAAFSKVSEESKNLDTNMNQRERELKLQKREYSQSKKDYRDAKERRKVLRKGVRVSKKELRKSRRALILQKKADKTDKQTIRDLKVDVDAAKFRRQYAKVEYRNAVKALDKAKAKRKAEKALVKIRRKTLAEATRERDATYNKRISELTKLYEEAPKDSVRRKELSAAIEWYGIFLNGPSSVDFDGGTPGIRGQRWGRRKSQQ